MTEIIQDFDLHTVLFSSRIVLDTIYMTFIYFFNYTITPHFREQLLIIPYFTCSVENTQTRIETQAFHVVMCFTSCSLPRARPELGLGLALKVLLVI